MKTDETKLEVNESTIKVHEEDVLRVKRVLKLRDLVLFNIVAVLGLRHLAVAAKYGPSSLVIWLIAAICFFVPQSLAVIELSSRFPEEGGIYFWTKRLFGEGHGFLCGWCYWINNVLYYPNLLISAAVIATYAVGYGDSGLESNWTYVLTATLVSLWLAVLLNIVGAGAGKWLQNAGGLGTYLPGALLIVVGVYAAVTTPAANKMSEALRLNFTDFSSLNLLATIAFAFAGLELSATMGDEVEDPRRNLPYASYISAPLIAVAYIAGTGAILWLVPKDQVNIVSGFLQAINAGVNHLSGTLWWAVPLASTLYTIGNIGGVGAWLIGPARVAFAIGLDRYFPPAFGRVHSRWRTPYVAILVQAVIATVFLLLSVLGKGSTVENVYLMLLDTQVLIYFIPYVYLFLCFLSHCRRADASESTMLSVPGGKLGVWAVGLSGLFITLFAMAVTMIPPPGTASPWVFRLKVIGGASSFVLFGGLIYWRSKWAGWTRDRNRR